MRLLAWVAFITLFVLVALGAYALAALVLQEGVCGS